MTNYKTNEKNVSFYCNLIHITFKPFYSLSVTNTGIRSQYDITRVTSYIHIKIPPLTVKCFLWSLSSEGCLYCAPRYILETRTLFSHFFKPDKNPFFFLCSSRGFCSIPRLRPHTTDRIEPCCH